MMFIKDLELWTVVLIWEGLAIMLYKGYIGKFKKKSKILNWLFLVPYFLENTHDVLLLEYCKYISLF